MELLAKINSNMIDPYGGRKYILSYMTIHMRSSLKSQLGVLQSGKLKQQRD
jgi:hypothetical protein